MNKLLFILALCIKQKAHFWPLTVATSSIYSVRFAFFFFLRYVKSYLVPDKANLGKRKTSVKKKTLNPTFNEILRVRICGYFTNTQIFPHRKSCLTANKSALLFPILPVSSSHGISQDPDTHSFCLAS